MRDVLQPHGLVAPSCEDALRALRGLVGEQAESLWQDACLDAGVWTRGEMTVQDIAKAAHVLVQRGGLVAVVARSIVIRANTYAVLALKVK